MADGFLEADYEVRARRRPLVSYSEVERAIDQKLVSQTAVTREELEDLEE